MSASQSSRVKNESGGLAWLLVVLQVIAICVGLSGQGQLHVTHAGDENGQVERHVVRLLSSDAQERLMAATALGEAGLDGAVAVPILVDLLDDDDPGVRLAADTALVRLGRGAVAVLLDAIAASPTRNLGTANVVSALSVGFITPLSLLEGAAAIEDGPLLLLLASSADTPPEAALWRALEALRDRSWGREVDDGSNRDLAMAVATHFGLVARMSAGSPARPDLPRPAEWERVAVLLNHRLESVRLLALTVVLAQGYQGEPIVDALIARLGDAYAGRAAIDALSQMGPAAERALPALRRLPGLRPVEARLRIGDVEQVLSDLASDSGDVRTWAAIALAKGKRRDAEVLAVLAASLREPHKAYGFSLHTVLSSIGEFGETGKSALPDLRKLLLDEDASLQVSAAGALLRIDPGDAAARATLQKALRSKIGGSVSRAVNVIRGLSTSTYFLSDLGTLLAQDDLPEFIQCAVLEALGGMGPSASAALESVVGALRKARARLHEHPRSEFLEHAVSDYFVYGGAACVAPRAIDVLGAMGPKAVGVASLLESVAKGQDPMLAYRASRALRAVLRH